MNDDLVSVGFESPQPGNEGRVIDRFTPMMVIRHDQQGGDADAGFFQIGQNFFYARTGDRGDVVNRNNKRADG